ncbi:hypothetical protein ACFQZI_06325 [Mucilaginibacter lutimaris]|uniref:Uncharacterized protein n=1 Tax=Mucilaginibacter lutimaris TaxID=931629 RepID=A0ABW2ZE33_9SPHI
MAKQFQGGNFATFKTLIIRLLSRNGEITGDLTTDDRGNYSSVVISPLSAGIKRI